MVSTVRQILDNYFQSVIDNEGGLDQNNKFNPDIVPEGWEKERLTLGTMRKLLDDVIIFAEVEKDD